MNPRVYQFFLALIAIAPTYLMIFLPNRMQSKQYLQLVADPNFQQGFIVTPWTTRRNTSYVLPSYITPSWGQSPFWHICQWNSQYSVQGPGSAVIMSGWKWENDLKKIQIILPVQLGQQELELTVNSDQDYQHQYRNSSSSDLKIDLLVEQNFTVKPKVSQLKSLVLQCQIAISNSTTIIESGYNKSFHAAQYQIYFIVQNLEEGSKGYGDTIQIGVPIFDDRFQKVSEYLGIDQTASNKLIYTLSSQEAGSSSSHNGQWLSINLNILPYMKKSLQYAYQHKIIKNASLDLFSVQNIKLGWEVLGRNIITGKIKQLTFTAEYL